MSTWKTFELELTEALRRWASVKGLEVDVFLTRGKGQYEGFFATPLALKTMGLLRQRGDLVQSPEAVAEEIVVFLKGDKGLSGWTFDQFQGYVNARPSGMHLLEVLKDQTLSEAFLKSPEAAYGLYRASHLAKVFAVKGTRVVGPEAFGEALIQGAFAGVESVLTSETALEALVLWVGEETLTGRLATYSEGELEGVYWLCRLIATQCGGL